MSFMTRAIGAFAALSAAAIPVGALTVKNPSSSEIAIGVDNGAMETVYKVTAGGSVDVKEDCSSTCGVTGPWGFSRMVAENATIETDGSSLVTVREPATVATAATTQPLIPQNPIDDPATSTAASTASAPAATAASAVKAPAAKPAKRASRAKASKPRRTAKAAPKGPGSGSLQMLFEGPRK